MKKQFNAKNPHALEDQERRLKRLQRQVGKKQNGSKNTIEDLNVNGMLKNHKLAKHLSDANFGEIRRQLTYKSILYGNTLHVVDRFFPSSKTCSQCGDKKHDVTLVDRTFVCPVCGCRLDRDLNAAINLNKGGRAHPEPKDACGQDGSVIIQKNGGNQLG